MNTKPENEIRPGLVIFTDYNEFVFLKNKKKELAIFSRVFLSDLRGKVSSGLCAPMYSANDRYLSLCNLEKFCGGAKTRWVMAGASLLKKKEIHRVLGKSWTKWPSPFYFFLLFSQAFEQNQFLVPHLFDRIFFLQPARYCLYVIL